MRRVGTALGRTRRIVLCADDFGLSRGIEEGILALAEQGRVSAVSCLVTLPYDEPAWRRLADLGGRVEIGLHFCLTLLPPLLPVSAIPSLTGADGRFRGPGALARACFLGRVSADEVLRELAAQIAVFTERTGRYPDFVDGHHHVHQLPVVRGAILRHLEGPSRSPLYVRNTWAPAAAVVRQGVDVARALALAVSGGAWKRALRSRGIRTNASFGGVYDWRGRRGFPGSMDRFLAAGLDGGLIMTHPGYRDPATLRYDPLDEPREDELRHLASPGFHEQLDRHRVQLGRLDGRACDPARRPGDQA